MRRGVGFCVSFLALTGCSFVTSLDYLQSDLGVPEAGAEAGTDAGPPDARADAGSYAAAVLDDRPVLYLRLGEHDGLVAADASGHGRDGAYIGAVDRAVTGAIASDPDTAVQFNGGEQLVRVAAAIDFPARAPFAIEAWVRPTAPSGEPFAVIAEKPGWTLFSQHDHLKFQRQDGTSSEGPPWFDGLPLDKFSHVVATFDGATMRLYVDGLDVGSNAANLDSVASTDALSIGLNFVGALDEVAIYDHDLSADRVRAHHDRGTGR